MATTTQKAPVAIVGAGMAGPVVALFLKKHNISSVLYELRDPGTQQGGNIALAPNALRVLDHAGVYDRIRLQGYNYEQVAFTNTSGHVLGHLLNGSQKVYNYKAVRIHRSIVKQELIDECVRQGIDIRWGSQAIGIENETDEGATVAFKNGDKVTARFIIGTDGIHSHIRKHIAPGLDDPAYSGLMGIMGTVDAGDLNTLEESKLPLPSFVFGDKGAFATFPSSFDGKEIGYFATVQVEDRGRVGWDALSKNTPELKQMLEERFTDSCFPDLVRELVEKTATDTLTAWQ